MKTSYPNHFAVPERPLVSIIVPSYNQGAFIRDTVQSCLDQDYRPIEIIVVDGASTDNTVEVLKSFGDLPELKWVSEPDQGVVDAVNKGFRRAVGEFAAIQSSDDYYRPGSIAAVVETFRRNPGAGLVYGDVERVDSSGSTIAMLTLPEFSLERLLSRELTILQPSAFFRREAALQLGGWNPAIPYVPDTDLWFRFAFHYPVVHCRKILAACRTHPGQRDVNSKRIYADYLKMLALSRELKDAPLRLRRAARAGAAMLRFRYGGPWSDRQLTAAAWRAVLLHPAWIKSPAFQVHRLVPAYFTLTRLKQKVGCWLHERWRTELVLRFPSLARHAGIEWPDLCNRNETVTRYQDGMGRVCQWTDSSFLTVARLFPRTGKRLLDHTWTGAVLPQAPVTVILPVRGTTRMKAVHVIAEALPGMLHPDSEVLICEHDETAHYHLEWPKGVRHLFVVAKVGEAFNKSCAMNRGACTARHPVLVFLDADVLLTPDCIFQTMELLSAGWEAVRPLRFLFGLDEETSQAFYANRDLKSIGRIHQVHQNFPGGMTAVRRDVYIELGGHDERFCGWGGEDLEFLDRLRTRKLYPGAFLPALHLWHPAAEQKRTGERNLKLLEQVLQEPVERRIEAARACLEKQP